MGLDAGEVQARLTARDEMSATIVSLTERIKVLKDQIEALGSVTGPSLQMLQQNLQGAQMKLAETKLALNEVNAELGETAVKAQAASGQFEQMERLATRMVERLLIFYALKSSFDFVVGLFEADAALVKLNGSTDLSLGKLQQLQYIAGQTEVPFKSLTAAVDQFDKRLSELKPETVDTLKGIGQDPSSLFKLSGDDRITAAIEAIAALPNQLQRTKAEIALFGNDAIDPLINKFGAMKDAASSAIRPDDQVQAMAQTVQMYKQFASELGDVASHIIADAQGAVTSLFAPGFMREGDPGAKKFQDRQIEGLAAFIAGGGDILAGMSAMAGGLEKPQFAGGGDLQIPKAGTGPGAGGNTPLMGDAFIASLRAQSLEVNKLSDAQLVQLDRLRSMNQLTADNAAKLDVSTTQYREFTKAVAEADSDWKKVEADFERFDGENYKLAAAQEAQITIMKLQGKTAREIADETNIPIQAIVKWERQWTMSFKQMEEAGKIWESELKANVDAAGAALNGEADALNKLAILQGQRPMFGAGSLLQPNTTGNPVFDKAADERDAKIQAAEAKMNRVFVGPDADQAHADAIREGTAEIQLADAEFVRAMYDATRATREKTEADRAAIEAANRATRDAYNAQFQVKDMGSPFAPGWKPGDFQPGGLIQLPSHKDGGPVDEGPAYLHDSEYVVPKGGALVMSRPGGGGDTYHITVPLQGLAVTTDQGGLAILERTVIKAVDSVMRQGRRFGSA